MYAQSSDTLVHHRPLPIDHVKVVVDIDIEGDASLPVPVEEASLMTVQDACGTFVAWPLSLVEVQDKVR